MLTSDQRAWLDAIATCAAVAEARTDYPAEATVAQAVAESGWGKAVTGDFNFFGLTRAVAPDAPQKLCPTHERLTAAQIDELPAIEQATITQQVPLGAGLFSVALSRLFPNFPSMQGAVDCYVTLITTAPRYSKAWSEYRTDRDLEKLLAGIAAAGYATGAAYARLLRQIAMESLVMNAVAEAREPLLQPKENA